MKFEKPELNPELLPLRITLNALLLELKQPIISETLQSAMSIEKYKSGLTETQLVHEIAL